MSLSHSGNRWCKVYTGAVSLKISRRRTLLAYKCPTQPSRQLRQLIPDRRQVYFFFLLGFFAIFSTTISKNPVLPLFSSAIGADDTVIGLIAAFSPLAGILFSFPVGVLSDHLGRHRLLIPAGVVFLVAPLLYLFITDPYWLIPALRAAVLTGEAAVDPGAFGRGQAMVAGDLVNTASRLQSVAPPGVVLVGESTRRAAERAIAFEPAGEQTLKGKLAPVPAYRALRVVAERGGANRSEGVEAPFVGRDDELRLLKDFFHATGRERQPRLISVTGQAGVGKSRLAWEFLKYIDGVLETIYWHEGRSPAFGEGVTFWALAEMVRRRAGLAERDDEATTRERLGETLLEFVPDPGERERLEPALLALLGFGDAASGRREELFAAWRTFFERVAADHPAILLFEDLQWADPGLVDFIDHLMEWANGPIYVVTLARPDLLDRRPGWGAARRNFVALSLGPLQEASMRALLGGLAPDLPERTVGAILARAGGVPLYAVELVRMLVADGDLVPDGSGTFRVTGELGDLHVPETLHALIAARLDALDHAERAILQDAAVLGQTFSLAALAALTGDDTTDLEARLRSLVRREVLRVDTDPRSPERGQHGFTQALLREVAYGTLAKRDRRAKHLAAARYYEALGDEAVAGMLATHYFDAYLAAPDGAEGAAIAGQARIALRAARTGPPRSGRTTRRSPSWSGPGASRPTRARRRS